MKLTSIAQLAAASFCFAVFGCSATPSRLEQADTNRDGQLDVGELEARLAEGLHEAGDGNGDGIVTLEEWTVVYPQAEGTFFRKYDTDGVRGLSMREANAGHADQGTFKKLSSRIDTNGDRTIDPEEAAAFREAMQAAKGQNDAQKLVELLK